MALSLLQALILTIAFCGVYSKAVPLEPAKIIKYQDAIDDDDDTEVIEIPSNAIEELLQEAAQNIIDLSFYGESLYGLPDNDTTAQLVANYTPEASSVNPEELGSYLEGDILVPISEIITKNGITSQSSRWPNGVVPFEIRGNFNARDMATIEHAMEEYHRRTCIRFVPRSQESDYISIVSGNSGCWSSVGRVGGKQEVNLQSPGCLSKPGTPIHELMHAIGFLHEQNRQERDNFVSIQLQNVQPQAVSNFEKASRTLAFGVPYDYGSVMHYSANAFSNNGRPTIVAVQPGGSSKMGQRDGFSAFDVEKLNKMYNCGFGGGAAAPVPYPVPARPVPARPVPVAPMPVRPMPGPVPVGGPVGPGAGNNNLINSFLGGLINGLGLGDEETTVATPSD